MKERSSFLWSDCIFIKGFEVSKEYENCKKIKYLQEDAAVKSQIHFES